MTRFPYLPDIYALSPALVMILEAELDRVRAVGRSLRIESWKSRMCCSNTHARQWIVVALPSDRVPRTTTLVHVSSAVRDLALPWRNLWETRSVDSIVQLT